MCLFPVKIVVTKFQLKLSIDPGAVWLWFADNLDPLSRDLKVYAPVRPCIPSPVFDGNSTTSMHGHCDGDLTVGAFKPKFDVLQDFSSRFRPR